MNTNALHSLARFWTPPRAEVFWQGLAFFVVLLFGVAAAWVSVNRYWQFETFYYDFGIYDQAIRRLADFKPPVIEHYTVGGKVIWADHFHPGIMLLAPIYWFTDRGEALLVAQALAVAASACVVFLTARHVLQRGSWAFAVLVSYVLFAGTQNALITDFHEITIMSLFLSLTFWAVAKGHKWRSVFFFVMVLLFKELFFLTGLGMAFFIFFYRTAWRKLAVVLGLGALAYGLLAIKVIIPFFNGGSYNYIEKFEWGQLPVRMVYPYIKLKTLFFAYASFLFLPLLYLPTLPLIILNFVPRFLSEAPSRWDLGMHYNAEIAPTLAVSAAFGLLFVSQKWSSKLASWAAVGLVLTSLFLYRFILHGPLALAYNPAFADHSDNFGFLEELIAQVPEDATVMTMNNLAVRFTDKTVYLLRDEYRDYKPQYIVLDMRDGQNPNNFYASSNPERFFTTVLNDADYEVVYKKGDQYVFKRKE